MLSSNPPLIRWGPLLDTFVKAQALRGIESRFREPQGLDS